jgi:hypothetical protein
MWGYSFSPWCDNVIPQSKIKIKMPRFNKMREEAEERYKAEKDARQVRRKAKLEDRRDEFAEFLKSNMGGAGFEDGGELKRDDVGFVAYANAICAEAAKKGHVYAPANGVESDGTATPSVDDEGRRVFHEVGSMPPRRDAAEKTPRDEWLFEGTTEDGELMPVPDATSGAVAPTPLIQLLSGYPDRDGPQGSGREAFARDVPGGTCLDVLNATLAELTPAGDDVVKLVLSVYRGKLYLRAIWDEEAYLEHERASAERRKARWEERQKKRGGGGGGHRGREDKPKPDADGFTLVRRGRRGRGGAGGAGGAVKEG